MPVVYLLCGLPGSGKTTYAKELEKGGVVRLTLDEELFRAHGRQYSGHAEKQAEMKERLLQRLVEHVKIGQSVALDFGFWKKADRDRVKDFVRDAGAKSRLVYFKQPLDELKRRIRGQDLAVNHEMNDEMMDMFVAQFEEPENEGEEVVSV